MFQNDSERHSNSIGQRDAPNRPNPRYAGAPSQHPHVALAPDRLPAHAHPAVSIRHWRILGLKSDTGRRNRDETSQPNEAT
jgi:hypothetical protein